MNSLLGIVRAMFSMREVKGAKLAFLTQQLCQDPIENFFGCQKQRGGTSDNPNVKEFYDNTETIRYINSFCQGSIKGNCRGSDEPVSDAENAPLPKRQRKTVAKTKKLNPLI